MALQRGRQVDLLHGSIWKSIVLFALPLLVSNVFQQVYNLADTVIVAHFLGDQALAAMGACTAIYDLLVGFALGLGSGLSVVTARSFGSGNRELLKRSVATALVIGLATSLLITLLAQMVLRPLLVLLKTPADIIEQSYDYISAITMFTLVMFSYNLFAGLLQAIGNSVMPLVFLVLASVLNIFLDILFITRFAMGVAGAAYATVLAQGISAVLCLVYLILKTPMLVPEKRHFAVDKGLYQEMLGQGVAMALMGSIVSAGTVILQYAINGFGTLIIAGHTTARKVYVFCAMPISAISLSVSTFVAQNRGANQIERIRKGIRWAYGCDVVLAAAISVFQLFLAPTLVRWVSGSTEPVIIENASLYLRVVGPFYAILGMLIQTRNALQGMGAKFLPLVSSVIELVGKLLFVLLLIPKFGYLAVIFCEPVIWCAMFAQCAWAFFRHPLIRKREAQS